MHLHSESHFKAVVQGPSKMFWQATTEELVAGADRALPSGMLRVCDGADQWTYSTPGVSFYRSSLAVNGSCEPPYSDFSRVADDLVSAHVIGHDRAQFAGHTQECQLVRAEYAVPMPLADRPAPPHSLHTLCIDPAQRIILRDRKETHTASDILSVETTSYSSYERDTALPADLFQFQVPTGTFQDFGPKLQDDTIAEAGVYRPGPPVSDPIPISKLEPSEIGEARVFGVVLVSFQVNPNGNTENLKVVRGLGRDFDEKAIRAVSSWRFRPGAKDGLPVTVGPLVVAVRFRRP